MPRRLFRRVLPVAPGFDPGIVAQHDIDLAQLVDLRFTPRTSNRHDWTATMNLYDATIPIFTKYLGNLDRWLDAAVVFAKERNFDPELYVEQRLAVDQFPLRKQIQEVCDVAKFCAAKMTGKEPPSHPDTEKTLPELRARIQTCLAYLKTFTREDFAGAEERRCAHQWMQGKAMRGGDYLDHYALPNFHFHLTTAYAILRHSGVKLGKNEFLGDVPFI